MPTSLFQYAGSTDQFAPSDMAETPEEFARLVRDDPRSTRSTDQQRRRGTLDRNALIAAMVDEGNTLTEVGRAFGLTRERVRQLYARERGYASTRASAGSRVALAVIGRIRSDPSIDSWQDVYAVSGTGAVSTLRAAIRALGFEPALRRLFRMRTNARRRQHVIDALRTIARETGRNPRMIDLFAAGTGAAVGTLYKAFPGGFPDALAAAGFPQNPKGKRGTPTTLYDKQRAERGQVPFRVYQNALQKRRRLTRKKDSLD